MDLIQNSLPPGSLRLAAELAVTIPPWSTIPEASEGYLTLPWKMA